MSDEAPLNSWDALLERLSGRRIVAVGDLILDAYVRGDVSRISPEAPVPVVEIVSEEHRLGGAANVGANVSSLGATCHLIGAVGADPDARRLAELVERAGMPTDGLVEDPSRPTCLKTRVLARNQQIVRLDRESRLPISPPARETILARIRERIDEAEAVVIADYDKGVLDEPMIAHLRRLADTRGIPVIVDPKVENFWAYRGATCVTPNVQEAGAGAGLRIVTLDELRRVAQRLAKELDVEFLLITRGPDGMSLFERAGDGLRATHIPTVAREVYDVTGAGDTVVGVFALGLAAGATPIVAARLANYAAGIVVGQLGCATVTRDELRDVIAERAEPDARRIRQEWIGAETGGPIR